MCGKEGADDDPAGQQPGDIRRELQGLGADSCGHSRGNPLVRAAHSQALKGALAKQPTGASHGLSRTLANAARCVISLKSAPRSLFQPKATAWSAPSHGTKNEQGLCPDCPCSNGPTRLSEAPP